MPNTKPSPALATRGSAEVLCKQNDAEHNRPTTETQVGPQSSDLRHRCRNPRCRMKLPAPVENEHRAFCTRGCYESFYLNRCRVCERDLRKTGKRGDAGRLYCRPPANCRREAEKWPEKYAGGLWGGFPETKLRSAHSTGLKIGLEGDRPLAKCLAHYRWGGDPDRGDHSLYDKNDRAVARIVLQDDGRYHLRSPITWPPVSSNDLGEARHRAEALALAALPCEPKLSVQIKRANEAPHPMGPPLNRQLSQETAIVSDWRPTGNGADMPDLPDFLRKRA
jgi:hypothetical protein